MLAVLLLLRLAVMSILIRIGEQIRLLRGTRTQREIAEIAGVTNRWISELERGTRTPTLNTLAAIARALGATVELEASGSVPMDGPERELLTLWRGLDGDGQAAAMEVIRVWSRLSDGDRRILRGLIAVFSPT